MINFNFSLRNPFSQQFKNLWSYCSSTPFEYKFIELQLYKDSSIIAVDFMWTIRQSHSGLRFELGLFGYCCEFNFYDSRHWDYTTNAYQHYKD